MSEKNIKKNILTVISGFLCTEGDLRRASEDRRKALEFTEEYAVVLIDIMMDFGEPIEERLMASILLKQYIVSYWYSDDVNNVQPVLSEEIKEKIKKFLPAAIGDSNRQLRQSTAHIMAHIAALDYPQRWPNMMTLVEQMLQSVSKEIVEGTVLFLKECLPYQIVSQLSPSLFNCLYEICGNEKYSTNIRATVISLISIFLLSDLEKNQDPAQEQIVHQMIYASKKFCGLLAYHLSQPYSTTSDFQLKSEIIGGAFIQFLYCDKALETGHLIISTLPIIWEILSKCTAEYIQIIGNHRAIPRDADEDEHYPKYFMKLVNNIFALVQSIAMNNDMNKHLMPILCDVYYSIMTFICITPQLEQEFMEDEHSYCADEFNNMVNNSLRTDLKTLLELLCTKLPHEKVIAALSIAINKMLGGGYAIKPDDLLNWRVNESVMCTIGCVSEVFKSQRTHHESFNIYLYLRNASLIVTECRNLILLARIMLVVGRFSCCMLPEQVVEHLSAIGIHLRSNQHILRNAAIRALNFHCQRISNSQLNCSQHRTEDMQKQHLQAFANVFNSLLDSLINVAEYLNPMIFGTTIKNICEITNMNQNLTANFANRLIPFILNTIAKNTQNAVIINRCKELIIGLSKNKICGEYIQSALMEPMLNLISYPDGNTNSDRTEAQSVGLYVLSILIENACSNGVRSLLYHQGFMLVVTTINSTDDLVVIEMGIRCLCKYLISSPRSELMRKQMDDVLTVIYRLLEPARDEMVCNHIDKLVICAFKAFSHLMEDQHEKLVKCILSKLNSTTTTAIKESFYVIFLHYFYFNSEMIIDLLSKVPGPTGDSALSYVVKLVTAFKYIRSLYGKYLLVLVCGKFLESSVLSVDTRISEITMCQTIPEGNQEEIPILSFIFRELVDKFLLQSKETVVLDEDSEEYEDFGDEEYEVEDVLENELFVDLCKLLDEPITQRWVHKYLLEYMRTFSTHSSFKTFAENCMNPSSRQKLYSSLSENVQYY